MEMVGEQAVQPQAVEHPRFNVERAISRSECRKKLASEKFR